MQKELKYSTQISKTIKYSNSQTDIWIAEYKEGKLSCTDFIDLIQAQQEMVEIRMEIDSLIYLKP